MSLQLLLPKGELPTGPFDVPISNGVGPGFLATIAVGGVVNSMTKSFSQKVARLLAVSPVATIDFTRMTTSLNTHSEFSITHETLAMFRQAQPFPAPDPSEAKLELQRSKYCLICCGGYQIDDNVVQKGCCGHILHLECDERSKSYRPEHGLKDQEPAEKRQERDAITFPCAFCQQNAVDKVGHRTTEGWRWNEEAACP